MPDNFDFTIISATIGICIAVFTVVGSVVIAISTWRNSNSKIKDATIVDLKTALQVKTEEAARLNEEKSTLILDHQQQLTAIQKELATLQGKFEEQGKKLVEYSTILENRDPKTLEMLTNISKGIEHLTRQGDTIHAERKIVAGKAQTVADTLAKKKRVLVQI